MRIIGRAADSRYEYRARCGTVGAKPEPTTSTGALLVPSGSASSCQGPRPIVEYAHGTSPVKNYDIAQLSGSNASSEGLILAAPFARNTLKWWFTEFQRPLVVTTGFSVRFHAHGRSRNIFSRIAPLYGLIVPRNIPRNEFID